jgi:sugar phosphate isomerase/epimerase
MFHPMPPSDARQTRRHFLHLAGALAVGTACARPLLGAAPPDAPALVPRPAAGDKPGSKPAPPMQIGILLGTYARPTLEARLDAAKANGLDSVQVSLDCAGLPAMPDEITPDLAGRIRRAVAAGGLTFAAMQGTFNMSHPDAEQRRIGLRRLRVLAGACQQLGTTKIHICTGTRDRNNMWGRHPDNDTPAAWRDMAACVREAADIARQTGVVLAFEPEVNNVVDSAAKARRLMDEIGSPHLKVTMDPANIFHAGELPRMKEMLEEAFRLVGKDIVLAHAKDLDHDGDAGHKAAGQGKLDYDRYLALLLASGFKGPLLLHGLSEAQVPGCVAFLREKLARAAATLPAPAR